MKRLSKRKITFEEAIDNIPHCDVYCNCNKRCPYFQIHHVSKNKFSKICKDNLLTVPTYRSTNRHLEYCSFLRDYLSTQDGCKDCGINQHAYSDGKEIKKTIILSDRALAKKYKEMFPEESCLINSVLDKEVQK